MSLINLASELGLTPKCVASTNGGEYHSPCPNCGGKDRFIIWEKTGRYYCRRCDCKGDMIQFCRDFMHLKFVDACAKAGAEFPLKYQRLPYSHEKKFVPVLSSLPEEGWQKMAFDFIRFCYDLLMKSSEALTLIRERGFTLETVHKFQIGWNPTTQFASRTQWGLPKKFREDGRESKIWLPRGLVIPAFQEKSPIKIKIRRSDWVKEDVFPKYAEVTGSMKCSSLYGAAQGLPILVLESEFDAILVQQECGNLCSCLAIGGATKKPDASSDQILRAASQILFALDFDDAGKKAYAFWRNNYTNLKAWPVPREKGPGDAYKVGINLRRWIEQGVTK